MFSHVKPEDAGLYTCVAATCGGKVSCSAELTVQGAVHHLLREPEPPSVVMELADTEVNAGGSAMLELKIKGFPKPKLCWTHAEETEPIAAGGRYRFLYEDEESAALIIKSSFNFNLLVDYSLNDDNQHSVNADVEQKDAGLYKVVATNDLGEVTTQGHLLVKAPPKFKNKMQDMACMTEQPCKVQVNIEGSPTPELKWYKKKTPLKSKLLM